MRGRSVVLPVLAVGTLAVLCGLAVVLAPYYTTILAWNVREFLPWALMLVLLVVAVFAAWLVTAAATRSDGAGGFAAVVVFVVGGVLTLLWMYHTSYDQDRTYAATVRVVNDPVPQLAARAPYQVGEQQARPNLGDVPGDIANTTYLPGQDRYATLVERRGTLSGYEVALTQQIPLAGRGAADQKCRFSKAADARIGGNLGHNLGRLIAEVKPWVRFYADDVYAYCDGNRPVVVVPLKKLAGVFVVTQKPAGVALYDGLTGKVTVKDDGKGVPGPSYPLSLAARQREATTAVGSFGDWWADRAGWETPDDDTNSGNDSEFTLSRDGQPVYVTPLTGRGSATSISVVTEVPATARTGGLAPLYVHRLNPTWVSPKAIVDRIKADYQDLPNWPNIKVYEVMPTGADRWVATLGTGQNILYRVTGTGTLTGDKPTCLQNADGSDIRCGSVANRSGNGVGTQYGSTVPTIPGQPVPDGDFGGLSPDQLADLQRRVSAEYDRRARAHN